MIRIITASIFLILFLIGSIPLMIIEYIVGLFSKDIRSKSSLAIVNWAFRCILKITGVKLTVIGEEHVPKDEAVLYVGNHTSFFDVLLTYTRVPRPTGYIAKKSMEKVPLLNIWMKLLYCQFLDRENLKAGMQTILKSIDTIKSGVSMCIFPEGTRNKTPDTLLPFHDGSLKIAKKANCRIVPMALTNASAIFEDQFPKIKKVHVILEYGKPYYYTDLSKEDQKNVGAYVQNQIQEMHLKNKALL